MCHCTALDHHVPLMEIDPRIIAVVVGVGLAAFALLFLVAWRSGSRTDRTWQTLAASRGWRCERSADRNFGLVLRGATGPMAWTCSVRTGPGVITNQTATKNITRLETVWSAGLHAKPLEGELSIYDNAQFATLRNIATSPLMHAMAQAAPGRGGNVFRAGLAAANAPTTAVGAGHTAIAETEVTRRFVDSEWQAAFERFARANAGVQHRLYLAGQRLDVAVQGSIAQPDRLLRFIESSAALAQATQRRLTSIGAA